MKQIWISLTTSEAEQTALQWHCCVEMMSLDAVKAQNLAGQTGHRAITGIFGAVPAETFSFWPFLTLRLWT